MASGRIPLTVTQSGYWSTITGYIEWTESDISIDNNTSKVTASLVYNRPADGNQGSGWGSSNFYLEIDGTRFTYTGEAYIYSGGTLTILAGSSKTITHNADGSKSITISGGGYLGDYSGRVSAITDSSGSASVALDTIARASTFGTIVGSSIGSPITINIEKKADFYHKVTYSFGNATGTAGTTNATNTQISWTPAYSTFGAQIPNSTSGVCTLTLATYSDSAMTQQVGNSVTTQITLSLPNTVLPTVSALSVSETVSANNTGAFIQLVSKPNFTATVGGIYGSTVSRVVFNFDGIGQVGTVSGTSASSGAFPALSNSGSLIATVTVTDSRGRSRTSQPLVVNVLAYSMPVLSSATAERQSDQTKIRATVSASVSSISVSGEQNLMEVYALYTVRNGTMPTPDAQYQITTTGLSATDVYTEYTLSESSSYAFRIMVRDKFYTVYQDITVSTATTIMDITDQGYIGINKRWERGALDVKGRVYISNGNLYVGDGKTGIYDGNAGASLGQIGLSLQGSPTLASGGNYPNIRFFGSSGSTTATIGLHEYADGFLTIEDNDLAIKHAPARTNGQASAIQFVPLLDPTTISYSGTTGMVDNFLKAWIGYVCNNMAGGGANSLYIGSVLNGSKGIIIWFVYDMETLTNDLPQYSMGLVIPYSQSANMRRFGTASYTFWAEDVGGGASYQNADDISF